jgi:hypothetical protein
LVAATLGRGRRRVKGGVIEVDAGAGQGGRVRVCSLDLVGLGEDRLIWLDMEVETGAGRRLGAVASAGFLRSPWAAAAAVVGKAGGRLSLVGVRGSEEGEGEARRRGSRRREEAQGMGRQRNRVWGSFYTKQT